RRAVEGEKVRGFYEYPIRTKNGEIRFIEINMAAEFDRERRIQGFSGVARDTTQRKLMEQELVRLERLRALGEMSAGVSHNLNNILTGILGPAEFLRASTDDPNILTHVGTIRSSAERAATLVGRLHRAVRREEQGRPAPVEVNEVMEEVVEATRPRWADEAQAQGIAIEVQPDLGDVPQILGTRTGLHDILASLLSNSVDAMPKGGTISIVTRETGDSVTVTVRDTGVGMDRETQRRVFEPFFTTKAEVGTGLGLSTAYNTVSRWGGTMEVESAPGKGTTFTIQLPAWRKPRGAESGESSDGPAERGRIVIVEDQEVVCELLSSFLSHDHTVETFLDGPTALSRFEPGAYDIALIDLGMPGMPGDQVAREMKKADPSLVAVLVTGWEIEESDPRSSPFDLRLQKPFTRLADLEAVVAQAFEIRDRRKRGDE
ncbi:MAG: ATP-binding protein, partial [Candidatus Latescibacteria bacterium]|nr:ATP-binding protein [Candidatus Latescibacterota bacterium]